MGKIAPGFSDQHSLSPAAGCVAPVTEHRLLKTQKEAPGPRAEKTEAGCGGYQTVAARRG